MNPRLRAAAAASVLCLAIGSGAGLVRAAEGYTPVMNANEDRNPNAKDHAPAFTGQTRAPVDAKGQKFTVASWAKPLDHPWSLVFLPRRARAGHRAVGRADPLMSRRTGVYRRRSRACRRSGPRASAPGSTTSSSTPSSPRTGGSISRIWSRTTAGKNVSLSLMRAELNGGALSNQKVIFRALPIWQSVTTVGNTGGRMLFDKKGMIVMTVGDRYPKDYTQNQAQLLNSDLGKVIRIDTDGNPARDNPFYGRAGRPARDRRLRLRSEESLAINPKTGALWEAEHGPRGGDEINIIKPGKNYGWPVITYGIEYDGNPILGNITSQEGMEQPIYYWDPVIAPSGMLFYTGDRFPAWKGSLFIGGQLVTSLVRLTLDGDRVVGEERLLKDQKKRIRDIVAGPDGLLYLLTDENEGEILRLTPG